MTRVCLFLLTGYRLFGSPLVHALAPGCGCRYRPTCSEYARDVVAIFPLHVALGLIVRRLLSCHPFHKGLKS